MTAAVTPEKTRVGWIGTGIMGLSMCGHVLDAGYPTTVFNRTRSRAQSLLDKGARWADSPLEVARESDVVFAIVGLPEDVREVALGDRGAINGLGKGGVFVDMTTSEPSLAVEIHREGGEKGIRVLDAPVSGGDVGARAGTLSIMVGGDPEPFEFVLPLFQTMGKSIRLMGKAGSGQHTKASNQIMVAGAMIGMVECLLYAVKAGLNINEVIEVVGSGAAANWALSNYGPRIAKGDMNPGFVIEHFLKDMGIVLKEAEQMNLPLPGLALCRQLYLGARALGYGSMGTQSLFRALEVLAGGKAS